MKGRRAFLQHSAALAGAFSMPMLAHAAARRAAPPQEAVSLQTPAGPMRGMRQGGVDAYKGIPYAQPPVGALRFKPPVPLPSPGWDDTWNGFDFGPAPVQSPRKLPGADQSILGDVPISEDCLRLNVWAPVEPGPHPVFVWIYGGSNIAGASSQAIYDGTHFAEQGIVCVTLNYRVGALGFLELGSVLGDAYRGSGNNANRDQLLALQWVRNNIAAFGGDPARVTLAGESAGGKSVAALMAMPASAGLFQSAIIESGGGQTVHDLPEADRVAGLFLQALGTQGLKKEDLLTASPDKILQAQAATIASYQRAFAFRSVVDGTLLSARPQDAIAKGASNQVRLLIGSNHDESMIFFSPDALAAGRQDPSAAAPFASRELAQLHVVDMEKMTRRYQQTFSSTSAFDRRIAMLTAEEYWVPTVRLADAHALAGGDTWSYRFERPLAFGPFQGYTVHGSELPLVWGNLNDPFTQMFYKGNAPMPPIGRAMQDAWVAFIKGGEPASRLLPRWLPYSPEPQKLRPALLVDRDPAAHARSRSKQDDDAGVQPRETMLLRDKPELASNPSGDALALWDNVL
ncbi:carboxylesterase family protein [Robbsia sp. KACC 23696]|uniref:carboxylesterase/lipase family protein n=1 Tax=Robbsia sp. KACC 23696 TaxID=3149231 RepID=UPI00325BCE84